MSRTTPGAQRRGIPFVVAAPSGTGKTSVCREVVRRCPNALFSVSHTTRPRRPAEVDGRDYHFVDREAFQALIAAGAFLEWAEYNGHHYGTSWQAIDAPLAAGRDVLLEIEIQGARQVRVRRPDACLIFLLPPSLKRLEERLRGRGTDDEAQIAARLALARKELAAAGEFDYALINDDLEGCVESLLAIVAAERGGSAGLLRGRFSPAGALESLARAAD